MLSYEDKILIIKLVGI